MDCADGACVALSGAGGPQARFRVCSGTDVPAAFQRYLRDLAGPVNACYQAALDSTTLLRRVLLDAEFECSQLCQASRIQPGSSIAAPLLSVCQASLNLARARVCHAAAAFLQQLQQSHSSCLEALQAQATHTAALIASLSKQQESLEQKASDITHERQRESQYMQMLSSHKDNILRTLDRERRRLRAKYDKLKSTRGMFSSFLQLVIPATRKYSQQLVDLQKSLDEVEKDEQKVLRNFSNECKRFADTLRQLDTQSVDCETQRNEVLQTQKRLATQSEMTLVMAEQSQALQATLSDLQDHLGTAIREGYSQATSVLPKLRRRLEELENELLRCNQELQDGQPSEGMQAYQRAAVTRVYLLVTQVRLQRVQQVLQQLNPERMDMLHSTQDWVVDELQEHAEAAELGCLCKQWALQADTTVMQPDWMWVSAVQRQGGHDIDRGSRSSSQAGFTDRASRSSRHSSAMNAIQALCGASALAGMGPASPHSSLTSPASRVSSGGSESLWYHNTAPAILRIPQASLHAHGSLSPPVSRESSILSPQARSQSVHSMRHVAASGSSPLPPTRRNSTSTPPVVADAPSTSVTAPVADQPALGACGGSLGEQPPTPRIFRQLQQAPASTAAGKAAVSNAPLHNVQDDIDSDGAFSQFASEPSTQMLQLRLPSIAVNKHLSRVQGTSRRHASQAQVDGAQAVCSQSEACSDAPERQVIQLAEEQARLPVVVGEDTSGGLTCRSSLQSESSVCSAGSFSFWDPFMCKLRHSKRLFTEPSVTNSSASDSPTCYQAVTINAASLELHALIAEAADEEDRDAQEQDVDKEECSNKQPNQQASSSAGTPLLLNDLFEASIL